MRYRFRGLIRETAKPVEGHVEAPSEDVAYQVLGDNGIVCESLVADPRPGERGHYVPPSDHVTSAIDSALDTSASQVDFDRLTERYKGKRVWVLDRGKIRDRVKTVVMQAIQQSAKATSTPQTSKDEAAMMDRVATAIDKMFADQRNVATQTTPEAAAAAEAKAKAEEAGGTSVGGTGIEDQIARLSSVVRQLEMSMSEMSAMVRRGGFGGGGGGGGRGGGGHHFPVPEADRRHDKVLLEIFESTRDLIRSVEEEAAGKKD